MKYMGSKARIAKYILPIILQDRKPQQLYIEPFCGGCNTIDKVEGRRLATDSNHFLIGLYTSLQLGWDPPQSLTEDEYAQIKNNKGDYPNELVAFVGFACSYAAKWFGGYCRGKTNDGRPRDYIGEAYRNVMKQKPNLDNVCFAVGDYNKLNFPEESIIYCDPPYANTTKYKDAFDHAEFWRWCREATWNGNRVFVSEYNAPDDFECVWQKEIVSSLTKNTGAKRGVEKLFKYAPQKGGS